MKVVDGDDLDGGDMNGYGDINGDDGDDSDDIDGDNNDGDDINVMMVIIYSDDVDSDDDDDINSDDGSDIEGDDSAVEEWTQTVCVP